MKHQLIMEGWRSYTLNESYEALLEKYDKRLITHQHFLNVWEENMIREGNELFTEGIMDLVGQALESGKELVGAVKEKVTQALTQVYEWVKAKLEELSDLSLRLYADPGMVVGKIKSLFSKVSSWCKASPKLCFVVKTCVVALFVAAIANIGGSDVAQAAIQMPAGTPSNLTTPGGAMNQGTFNIIYGGLKAIDPGKFPAAEQAAEMVRSAYESSDIIQFENLPKIAHSALDAATNMLTQIKDNPNTDLAKRLMKQLIDMTKVAVDARGGP